jgi:hypothetical protein
MAEQEKTRLPVITQVHGYPRLLQQVWAVSSCGPMWGQAKKQKLIYVGTNARAQRRDPSLRDSGQDICMPPHVGNATFRGRASGIHDDLWVTYNSEHLGEYW